MFERLKVLSVSVSFSYGCSVRNTEVSDQQLITVIYSKRLFGQYTTVDCTAVYTLYMFL